MALLKLVSRIRSRTVAIRQRKQTYQVADDQRRITDCNSLTESNLTGLGRIHPVYLFCAISPVVYLLRLTHSQSSLLFHPTTKNGYTQNIDSNRQSDVSY